MKIRTADIPPEGRSLEFELDNAALNERVQAAQAKNDPHSIGAPGYVFLPPTKVEMKLELEGSTVVVSGQAHGRYNTTCARCAEETEKVVDVDLSIFLKPVSERAPAAAMDEDVRFGYYRGMEVDCSELTEEFLILALPYCVICGDECKGLCPVCGINLNTAECGCNRAEQGDERFSILKQLKVQ